MFEDLSKLMTATVGALSMTRKRAEEIFDECVERGQAAREQRSKFVQDLMDSAEKARKDMEQIVSEQMRRAGEGMNLATREDLARLEQKLDRLLELHPHQ